MFREAAQTPSSMTNSPPPERFKTEGAFDVEEFELTSESWEEDEHRGDSESMGLLDPARYSRVIRFINKNKDARVCVLAFLQEDLARRYNCKVGANVEVPGGPGVGVNFEWQHVEGERMPDLPIECVLESCGEIRTQVPKGCKKVWYRWYVEFAADPGNWKYAGQAWASLKRNVIFTGVGKAKS